jgi:hypothetical protein
MYIERGRERKREGEKERRVKSLFFECLFSPKVKWAINAR